MEAEIDPTTRQRRLGRRAILSWGAVLVTVPMQPAWGRDIQSKASAQYVDHSGPRGEDCAHCQFFEPAHRGAMDGRCMVVAGLVIAHGWCDFYTPR